MARTRAIGLERTFVLIKPDGVAAGLEGDIIGRFLWEGLRLKLRIAQLKKIRPDEQAIAEFIPQGQEWALKLGSMAIDRYLEKGRDPKRQFGTRDAFEIAHIVKGHIRRLLSMGPSTGIIFVGEGKVITFVRKLIGATSPKRAGLGTIRGLYSRDDFDISNAKGRACLNVVHSSSNAEQVEREIAWFMKQPGDLVDTGVDHHLLGWIRQVYKFYRAL